MKRAIIMVLTLALVLSVLVFPVSYAEEAGERCYSLVEAGSFSDPMGEVVFNRGFVSRKDGDITVMLNNMGEKVTDYPVLNSYYLGAGVYVVEIESEDPANKLGLVSSEGEILVPFDAAIIEWPEKGKNGRFVEVAYATEMTFNEEECYIYARPSNQIIIGGGPGEGNGMYKGYSLVLDLDSGKFVENVEQIPQNVTSCGNCFITENVEGHNTAYDANGKVLFETDGWVDVGDGIITVWDGEKHFVFDDAGVQTFATEEFSIHPEGKYLVCSVDGKTVIRDRIGAKVLESEDDVSSVHGGLLEMYDDNFDYYLMDMTGKVLVKAAKGQNINYLGYGIYSAEKNEKASLVDRNGIIAEKLKGISWYDLVVSEGNKMLVLNDKEFSLELNQENIKVLQPALVAAYSDSNAAFGVFDLFTGEQLLPYEFNEIKANGNYLYAYKGGEYSVYEIIAPEY